MTLRKKLAQRSIFTAKKTHFNRYKKLHKFSTDVNNFHIHFFVQPTSWLKTFFSWSSWLLKYNRNGNILRRFSKASFPLKRIIPPFKRFLNALKRSFKNHTKIAAARKKQQKIARKGLTNPSGDSFSNFHFCAKVFGTVKPKSEIFQIFFGFLRFILFFVFYVSNNRVVKIGG